MRFVRSENERIAGYDIRRTIFVAHVPLARNNQIKLPLRRVCMIRKIWFSGRNAVPFEIERMTLGQIEGGRLASECFRNSFERDGVFSARRLPCLFFDLVDVYLAHFSLLSFFAIEIIRLSSLDDEFFGCVPRHRPLPAVGIVTGIARCAAAARIIGNHVVNEVFVTGVAKLMGFAGLKEKGIARSDFSYPVLIANVSPTGNYEVKLRFRRMRVIGTKRLAFRNPHQREIKRMALCQIERVWMTTERDRNVLRRAAKLSLWRLPFLLWD